MNLPLILLQICFYLLELQLVFPSFSYTLPSKYASHSASISTSFPLNTSTEVSTYSPISFFVSKYDSFLVSHFPIVAL